LNVIRDPYIVFSVLFIVLSVLLASYPIIVFLPSYVSRPHDLILNAAFTYYGTVLDQFTLGEPFRYVVRVDITYAGSDVFVTNFTLYELKGLHKVSVRPLRMGGFSFTAENISVLCSVNAVLSYRNSSFIRLVIPKIAENTTVYDGVEYTGFNRTSFLGRALGVLERRSLGISYPELYLGYARIYRSRLANTTSGTIIVGGSDGTGISADALFVRIGDHYLAYQLFWPYSIVFQTLLNDFGDRCLELRTLGETNLQALKDSKMRFTMNNEMLFLNYTNITPSDQPWIEVFWHNFNALAPLSYALIVVALILAILRVRRG